MCEFRCDICSTANDGGFRAVKYQSWVNHLLTAEHQVELRKKQSAKKKWRDEKDSYVLTGIVKTSGLPWSLLELAEWLSSFGVLTEFMYDERYYFCVFTLQGIGEIGSQRAHSITSQKELKGHSVLIRPKSFFGPTEWNLVYDTVDNLRRAQVKTSSSSRDFPENAAAISQPPQRINDQVPNTSNVPKGTRVFTNKNMSSSNNHQQSSSNGANGNNNYPTKEPWKPAAKVAAKKAREVDANAGGVRVNKEKKKSKNKGKPKENAQETVSTEGNSSGSISTETTSRVSVSGSSSISSGIMVPPSSLVPPDLNKKNSNSTANATLETKREQEEPLNFRGGFGRRGNEYKLSESSDNGRPIEAMVNTAAATQSSTSSENPPQVHVLQRTVVNDYAGRGYQNQKQRHQQPNNYGRGQSYVNHPSDGTLQQRPPQHYRHQSRPYHQQQYLLSSIFASQVMPNVAAALSNPAAPTSRNPYKFDNMPPFPHFFELFQKLPDELHKPQKDVMFKQFQNLNLPQQLEEFFLAQTLPFHEIRLRWQVVLDILFLLRQQFPRCEVYVFGSILSGVGDFKSDIDIYVDLVGESSSTYPLDPSHKMSAQQAVDVVKKVFRKSYCPHTNLRFVKNLVPVKSARVPILKLTHQRTLINCDLSFENRLSVQNTKLLSLYMNLDKRIFHFMVLIRYWAKYHGLTGSNYIKNYALSLLVLVYLTSKGFVPPVILLQRLKAQERKKRNISKNQDEIDGWDASFCDDVSVIKQNFKAINLPPPQNTNNNNNGYLSLSHTLIEMAKEFFQMYANLDFSKVVVCPLLGKIIQKEKFKPGNEESLPDALDRYKNWAVKQAMNRRLNVRTDLCVQDPFVLSFNVGSATPQGTLFRFQIACAKSLQIMQNESGLKSFTDVLQRLPAHIGEKKFIKTYKTEVKERDLRREIKAAVLGVDASADTQEDDQKSAPQVSSYVKLPPHLMSFDKLMDEKGLKQAAKRPRCELFIDFSLTSQFEDTLLAEMTRCRLQNNKRSNLTDTLCALWHQFTLDFLSEFFETGLKLKLIEKKEESVEPYYTTETNGVDSGGGSAGEEEGRRKRWKVKMMSKQDEEKLHSQATTQAPRTAEDGAKLNKKISELQSAPGVIHYKVIKYQVSYPFWERRPTIVDKIGKEMKEILQMVQIPILPTAKRNKKDKDKSRSKKLEKQQQQNGENSGKVNRGYWSCFNPIDLEAKVSEFMAKSYEKEDAVEYPSFEFSLLVKLDLSSTMERPKLFLIFEKDARSKCNTNDYLRAIQSIGNIITDAFPCYQIYRLATWLDMPVPVMFDDDTTKETIVPACSKTNSSKATDETQDKMSKVTDSGLALSNESGKTVEKKKKSTRSKLEEDLLIPSSSSSVCSADDDDNNDGLEDISNDEDDDGADSNDDSNEEDQSGDEVCSTDEDKEKQQTCTAEEQQQ